MNKLIILIIILLLSSILGCLNNNTEQSTNLQSQNDWCKPGSNISSIGPLGSEAKFVVKGITQHNGMQLCEADFDNNGTLVQYYNKNKTYNIMAIKTENGTKEIDVNNAKQ
jgi:hypothetical protein